MNIKIADLTWEVEFEEDLSVLIPEQFEIRDGCGLTFPTKLLILINSALPEELLFRTIIHELTHAYIWSYGWDNQEDYTQEDMCNFMETFNIRIYEDARKIYETYHKKLKKSSKNKNK